MKARPTPSLYTYDEHGPALSCSVIYGYLCFGEAEVPGLGKGGRGS